MSEDYTKLSKLVGGSMTIEEVQGYKYKMWLPGESRMHVSDTPEKGHRKMWRVVTDKGIIDLSDAQMGQCATAVMQSNGSTNVVGSSFEINSNGKTGMEIRYFINALRPQENNLPTDEEVDNAPDLPEFDY